MRHLRALFPAFCLTFALTPSTRAELLVVGTPGEPSAIEHAEVALASGSGVPATWLSLRVRRGPVAIVAALPDAVTCEPALDAWFSALERSVSSNVLLPPGKTDCGKSTSFVHVAWPRSRGAVPDEVTVPSAEDVVTLLEEQGLTLVDPLPSAPRYAVWSWAAPEQPETTRTLRLVGEAGPIRFVPPTTVPVLVSAFSRGPMTLPSEAKAEDLGVTFVAGEPSSNYHERLSSWLFDGKGPLLEARASSSLFSWSILADSVSLPPLVRSYALSAVAELPKLDADACAEQLAQLEGPDAPSPSACGDARDLSLALSATGPNQPVLERVVLSGAAPISLEAWKPGGDPSAPVLRATRVDDSACAPALPNPPITMPPVSGGGTTSPPRGGGTTVVVEEETTVDETYYTDDGCSCAPGRDPYYSDRQTTTFSCYSDTSSSSDDSCSSDSSSSSDDSCSSDSSSSSSDDSSCSSDSSSSSSDDSSCSSDSSSSSSDDSSCSSGSDSSYDGDTCTGRAAPGAEPKVQSSQAGLSKARSQRPKRVRLSLWATALAAALLPIRRRKPQAKQ